VGPSRGPGAGKLPSGERSDPTEAAAETAPGSGSGRLGEANVKSPEVWPLGRRAQRNRESSTQPGPPKPVRGAFQRRPPSQTADSAGFGEFAQRTPESASDTFKHRRRGGLAFRNVAALCFTARYHYRERCCERL